MEDEGWGRDGESLQMGWSPMSGERERERGRVGRTIHRSCCSSEDLSQARRFPPSPGKCCSLEASCCGQKGHGIGPVFCSALNSRQPQRSRALCLHVNTAVDPESTAGGSYSGERIGTFNWVFNEIILRRWHFWAENWKTTRKRIWGRFQSLIGKSASAKSLGWTRGWPNQGS